MDYKISQKLLQSILNYLSSRPYREVFQLILSIQHLELQKNANRPGEENKNTDKQEEKRKSKEKKNN